MNKTLEFIIITFANSVVYLLTSLYWIIQKNQMRIWGIKGERQSNYPNNKPGEYFQLKWQLHAWQQQRDSDLMWKTNKKNTIINLTVTAGKGRVKRMFAMQGHNFHMRKLVSVSYL